MQNFRIKDEYEHKLLHISRVARVVSGGRRFSFRTVVAVGNRRGRVGVGVAKGPDVSLGIEKAVRSAKKHLFTIPLVNGTIPHLVEAKYGSARIMLKPGKQGSGIIAGGPARVICDLAGVQSISAKVIGRTKNKINNARATLLALQKLKQPKAKHIASVPGDIRKEEESKEIV